MARWLDGQRIQRHIYKKMFTVIVVLLIFCVNCTQEKECANVTHKSPQTNACLFSNITLSCTAASMHMMNESLDVKWTLYPDNMTINSSSVMYNNDTSSIMFNVSQENVFFLVFNDTTDCPLCNISLSVSQSTDALLDATRSYFRLDANQSVMDITTKNLTGLVTTDELSVGNPNTLHTVGECMTTIHYADCLLEPESFIWYLNGSEVDDANFTVDGKGRLKFTNARYSHAGLYFCVTVLPGDLGSYITAAKELKLSTIETRDNLDSTDSSTTPAWVIALIVTISVITTIVLIIISIYIQIKAGFWCCYANRRLVPKTTTMTSIASKAEYLNHQSRDRLIKELSTEKPKLRRRLSSRKSTNPSNRASLIKDKWECEYSCILFEELLHEGTFKKIRCAIIGTHPVVVKELKNKESELGLDELMHETSIQKHIARISNYFEHPNVIGLYGACTMDPTFPYCLILEYMENGTLDKLLSSLRLGPLPDWYIAYLKQFTITTQTYTSFVAAELMEIIQQIVSAMIFLNRHGILHRDLSTRNIFIGDSLLVKVGNFGMTHEGRYYLVTERGHYLQDMAPECINEAKYSVKSDVWSFGMVLYKICSLETNPYPNVDHKDLRNALKHGLRAKMPSTCSEEMYFLMQRCWKLSPTDRPSFTTLQKCFSGAHGSKYATDNYLSFKLKSTQDQSDCTVDSEDIYLYPPPQEVAGLFCQGNNLQEQTVEMHDHWSNDELFSTMRTVNTELPSEHSSAESCAEETVQMRNKPKQRDRRQKRTLVFPTPVTNSAFAETAFANHQPQQKLSDKTEEPVKEKYTPFRNLFKSDPLNVYLEPAYKELLIQSESESSLDTDVVVNGDTLPYNHQQGGYGYAYP